jgi:hypothetical protein
MADRPVRRVIPKSIVFGANSDNKIRVPASGVSGEQGTEQNIDRSADADDRNANSESNGAQRIGIIEVEPEQLGDFIASRAGSGDGDGDGNGNRTRKQRADAGTKRGRRAKKEIPQNIEAVVSMVHTWASVILKTPELMLDESEVKALSDSYGNFCEYHTVPVLTPKRMSEITLIATALSIYGTRFVAVMKRKKEERNIHVVGDVPRQARPAQHPVM